MNKEKKPLENQERPAEEQTGKVSVTNSKEGVDGELPVDKDKSTGVASSAESGDNEPEAVDISTGTRGQPYVTKRQSKKAKGKKPAARGKPKAAKKQKPAAKIPVISNPPVGGEKSVSTETEGKVYFSRKRRELMERREERSRKSEVGRQKIETSSKSSPLSVKDEGEKKPDSGVVSPETEFPRFLTRDSRFGKKQGEKGSEIRKTGTRQHKREVTDQQNNPTRGKTSLDEIVKKAKEIIKVYREVWWK